MKITVNDNEWETASRLILKNEADETVVIFEDRATVLGTKTCVYDPNEKEIFFIDEDTFSDDNEYNIQKGATVVATIKKANGLLYRGISIKTRDGKYEYNAPMGTLTRGRNKVLTIKKSPQNTHTIEVIDEEDKEYLLTLAYVIYRASMR